MNTFIEKKMSELDELGRNASWDWFDEPYPLESFVLHALQEQQEEIIKKIESWNPEYWNEQSKTECRDDIISLLLNTNKEVEQD